MKSQFFANVVVGLFLASSVAVLAFAKPLVEGGDALLRNILDSLEHHDSMINRMSVKYTYERHYTEEAMANPRHSQSLKDYRKQAEMTFEGSKFRFEGVETAVDPDGNPFDLLAICTNDNEVVRMLFSEKGAGVYQGTLRRPDGNTSLFSYPSPLNFNLCMAGMFLGKYFKSRETVLLGKEGIEGKECYLLQCTRSDGYTVKVWIDPSSGFRAPRREVYDREGQLVARCDTEFRQYSGGIWFPSSGSSLVYRKEKSGERVLYQTKRVKVDEVRTNVSVSSSTFVIDFPLGTSVCDLTDPESPREFVVGEPSG